MVDVYAEKNGLGFSKTEDPQVDSSPGNVSFTRKLFDILKDESNKEIITWHPGSIIACTLRFFFI